MDVTLLVYGAVLVASVIIARRPIGNPSILGYLLGGIVIVWAWWGLGLKGYAYYLVVAWSLSLLLDLLVLRDKAEQAREDAEYEAKVEARRQERVRHEGL